MKYRIEIFTNGDGHKLFYVQRKAGFFGSWEIICPTDRISFDYFEEAKEHLLLQKSKDDEDRKREIREAKIRKTEYVYLDEI